MQKACYNKLLEIACFNVESCIQAQLAGADRIEFCADYSLGGITPNHEDILKAKAALHIPLHVIIRPRGGNFVYTENEIELMKKDIVFCKQNNINGVVFGVLNQDNTINTTFNKKLVDLAENMSTTFHRAVDECKNLESAFNQLIELGFTRVLTSGGKTNAAEGVPDLKTLQQKFGKQITIIPGGGIRSTNLTDILEQTGCFEFHSAALTTTKELVDIIEIKQLLEKLKQS